MPSSRYLIQALQEIGNPAPNPVGGSPAFGGTGLAGQLLGNELSKKYRANAGQNQLVSSAMQHGFMPGQTYQPLPVNAWDDPGNPLGMLKSGFGKLFGGGG